MATSSKKVTTPEADDEFDGVALPVLAAGETGTVTKFDIVAKETKPPALYNEDTLLTDMGAAAKFIQDDPELRKQFKASAITGLGTGATRAATIERLKQHKLIQQVAGSKSLEATEKGIAYNNWLKEVYPTAVDVAMTARWEAELGTVALSGGGRAFEERTHEQIRQMVETFKAAAPMSGFTPPPTKENSSMSESSAPRTFSKPTEKMVAYAQSIARNLGIDLPADVETSSEACRAFLDKHKDAAMRPSEKQVNFAQNIAQRKGITVPEEALRDGKKISAWINENKD